MCLSAVHVRLIVFQIESLKIERALVKHYKAKSLDGSPGKSNTEIRPFELGAATCVPRAAYLTDVVQMSTLFISLTHSPRPELATLSVSLP